MAKIAVPVVLVLITSLAAFFFLNNQLGQSPSQAPGLGTVNLYFSSAGLDSASQGQGQGQAQAQGKALGHNHESAENVTDVVIHFTKVEIHAADGSENDGWQPITVEETVIDFNHQQSTVNDQPATVSNIIGGKTLTAGKYNMLRLFADHGRVAFSDGVVRTLNIPSGNIKIPITHGGFDLASDGTADITLTFTFNAHELAVNPKNIIPVVKAQVTSTNP